MNSLFGLFSYIKVAFNVTAGPYIMAPLCKLPIILHIVTVCTIK